MNKNTQIVPKSAYKEEEWKEPEEGTQWATNKRREHIKRLGVEIGLYNINRTELAKKMGISRRQLYNDIKAIVKAGFDKYKLQYSTLEISNALEKVMKETHKILLDPKKKDRDRIRAADTLIKATESHTNFLERFGIKDVQTPVTESQITVLWGKESDKKKKGKSNKK